MTIEPYRFASGDAHGADAEQTPGPAQVGKPQGRGKTNNLTRRVRRIKTDPTWSSHSPETKQMLLDLDKKEGL